MNIKVLIAGLIMVVFSCKNTQTSNLPSLNASRDEAVINGTLLSFLHDSVEGVNCGNEHCYGKIKVNSVEQVGQDFTKNFNTEEPIMVYFSFGADGADSSTHKGLEYVLDILNPNDNVMATIKLVGELNSQKLYQVDLYQKIK